MSFASSQTSPSLMPKSSKEASIARKKIRITFKKLLKRFGRLDWWPAETRDEVIIGAILTQNTNWSNVEKALSNLRDSDSLSLKSLLKINKKRLAELIRPSGFYKQKAKRLSEFSNYVYKNYGGLDDFFRMDMQSLREELLSLNGIGMETADSILLYAADKPIFVIDAYTKRIISRMLGLPSEPGYLELQSFISSAIRNNLETYKEFHAQFVQLAKENCRKKPICKSCPILNICTYGKNQGTPKAILKKREAQSG